MQKLGGEEFQGLHHSLTEQIIRVFYQVYNELGFGFVESSIKRLSGKLCWTQGFALRRK